MWDLRAYIESATTQLIDLPSRIRVSNIGDIHRNMASYEPVTGILLGSSMHDTSHEDGNSTWKRASYLLCRAKDVWGQAQERFNTFLQAEVADKVLQHFNGQEKVQLACVCRVWRMWVSSSSSTVHLSGPDVQGQLTWLVQRIPARMLKDLTVCGCPEAPHELVDLATSVQRFTALRSLSLQPNGGITLSCVAALCSLQLLTRLTANLRFHTNSKDPVDLAEFTPLTGLQQLGIHVIVGNPDVRLSCKWAAFEQLTSLTLSGLNSLRQGVGPCGEVLHCLFQHLQYARIEVKGVADLPNHLASTTLYQLDLVYSEVWRSICSTRLPNTGYLSIDCENVHKSLFEGLPALLFLCMGHKCMVDPASIAALSCCTSLQTLIVRSYVCPHNLAALKEFALLTALVRLTLNMNIPSGSFIISKHLSGLRQLTSLTLANSQAAVYGGGIERLPALQRLALSGINSSEAVIDAAISSFSLTGLITDSMMGRGAALEEHVRLGWLRKLKSCHAHNLLEVTPTLLHGITSLRDLQELAVSIADDIITRQRLATSDDITILLKNLPALPSLRAARIIAVRRLVGPVDICCMSRLEHVAIACKELKLLTAGGCNSPKSFQLVTEEASPETVALLQRMDAAPGTLWTGRLYTSQGLQVWKAGLPHALDLHPHPYPYPSSMEMTFKECCSMTVQLLSGNKVGNRIMWLAVGWQSPAI